MNDANVISERPIVPVTDCINRTVFSSLTDRNQRRDHVIDVNIIPKLLELGERWLFAVQELIDRVENNIVIPAIRRIDTGNNRVDKVNVVSGCKVAAEIAERYLCGAVSIVRRRHGILVERLSIVQIFVRGAREDNLPYADCNCELHTIQGHIDIADLNVQFVPDFRFYAVPGKVVHHIDVFRKIRDVVQNLIEIKAVYMKFGILFSAVDVVSGIDNRMNLNALLQQSFD